MRILHSDQVDPSPLGSAVEPLLARISQDQLRDWVRHLARPRHYSAEAGQNRAAGDWLADTLCTLCNLGYAIERQGPSGNIIAAPMAPWHRAILVGAHYDSVPNCPGADDNASAVAALLGCATALSEASPRLPIIFAAFNREEDGFVGSREFVEQYHPSIRFECVHILEMIGYASSAPGSQRLPTGLPIQLRDTGDFLGLLANEQSAAAMQLVLQQSRAVAPELPVTGLEVAPGAERAFPVLARSDHVPFWGQKIPALMWTDTAEFRNPHYHLPTDTPETLDYAFLHRVTRLLAATVFTQASNITQ